jgi:hypothetical protein
VKLIEEASHHSKFASEELQADEGDEFANAMTGLREITGQAVKVTMTKFGTWRTRNS